ncbi:MAG: hypothetical protein O7G85_02705 [Planctomycetota bacterium]|nr:hypothetical protein [Planctomycetota bacterium]
MTPGTTTTTTTDKAPPLNFSLDQIQIASPCDADWESMPGDKRARHCEQCDLNVFNLSGMSRDEAMSLVKKTEGRLCVRFYRRPDGTILTKDCPVGLRALRLKMMKGFSRVAAVVAFAFTGLLYGRGVLGETSRTNSIDDLAPVSLTKRWLDVGPKHDPIMMGEMIMGDIALPPVMGRMAAPPAPPANTTNNIMPVCGVEVEPLSQPERVGGFEMGGASPAPFRRDLDQ